MSGNLSTLGTGKHTSCNSQGKQREDRPEHLLIALPPLILTWESQYANTHIKIPSLLPSAAPRWQGALLSCLPSLNSSSSSSLVQLQEVMRKKPSGFKALHRDPTYSFLFPAASLGSRLTASKVPLSRQMSKPDSSAEGARKSST